MQIQFSDQTGSGTRVDRSYGDHCLLDPDGHKLHCLRGPFLRG
jgi:hypothetical protein